VHTLQFISGIMTKKGTGSTRFREIDYFRGIAVCMMVAFHAVFDMAYFGVVDIDVHSGPWRLLALCTASLFLLIVGLSLTVSGARAQKVLDRRAFAFKYLRRGAGIMALGFLITLVTVIIVPGEPILFGILHLIGLMVMIAPLYIRLPWGSLCAGLASVLIGWCISGFHGPLFLAWLGIHPPGFASLDYTPVFPWAGAVFTGVFIGHMLYPGGERAPFIPAGPLPGNGPVCLLGRHSLAIYVVHQPVILLLLLLSGADLFIPVG